MDVTRLNPTNLATEIIFSLFNEYAIDFNVQRTVSNGVDTSPSNNHAKGNIIDCEDPARSEHDANTA
jgi:hypothetical protein